MCNRRRPCISSFRAPHLSIYLFESHDVLLKSSSVSWHCCFLWSIITRSEYLNFLFQGVSTKRGCEIYGQRNQSSGCQSKNIRVWAWHVTRLWGRPRTDGQHPRCGEIMIWHTKTTEKWECVMCLKGGKHVTFHSKVKITVRKWYFPLRNDV